MSKGTVIKKVLKYVAGYRWLLVLSLSMAFVSSLLSMYLPILIGNGVDLVLGPGNVDFNGLMKVLKLMALLVGISSVAQWIMNALNNRITYAVVKDIRNEAFDKLQHLPIAYMDNHQTGEIVSRIISDADQFADGLLMGFTQFFTGIVTIIGTLIFMLTLDGGVTILVVCLTPLSLFIASFIAKSTHSLFVNQSVVKGEQTALIDEMVGGVKVVKAFAHEEEAINDFDEVNKRLEKCSLKAVFFSSLTNPLTRFVNGLVYAGVAFLGGILVVRGYMSVGQLTSFLSYANQYTKPFNEISGVIAELQNALACAGRVFELIEQDEEPQEKADSHVLSDAKGIVELENVEFSYTEDKPLIENLNLNVKQGQRIAIVGPTGCGKTTIINLLMRFYDVNSGKISVDNYDIRDYTRNSLRSSYGMVLQETYLFAGTIRDNIAFGKPDASDKEIEEAAKKAFAHSFIKKLENGYNTYIGDNGGNLSQGQKQLICIARVMLRMPPVLILDEATSSIDTRTEIHIQRAFQTMMEGRTSFIVAHRLSTIKEADVILVMKDGHIIEQGNHSELIDKHGFYEELYKSAISA